MKLKDLKAQMLNHQYQVVIFDEDGTLVDSCNTIMDLKNLKGQSVYDEWPVLESIRPALAELENQAESFRLPAVELAAPYSKGIFDFEFSAHPAFPHSIVWLIIDQSRIYHYFRRIQQERNMLLLEKEYRETGRSIKIISALDG